jgi:hypothetical protein
MSEEKPPISIDLGAKASLEVKTEIPREASGRFVDAITDIFRPFSEKRGLKADLINLERQVVLGEIAKKVRERLEIEGKPATPLPNKVLLPLLEKASLENKDDAILIEMWANLIATAATQEVTLISQYIDILSQITSRQAVLLEEILLKGVELGDQTVSHFRDSYDYLNQTGLPGTIRAKENCSSAEELGLFLLDKLNVLGVAIDVLQVYTDQEVGDWEVTSPDGIFNDAKFYDFEMLERLGLLRKVEIKGEQFMGFGVYLHYYVVTPIGCDLFACCNPTKLKRENYDLSTSIE